ncbi:MAG: tRNA (adenosine(37)-N6)-threonylcarbamoyltransferase complex transferase subunit TsaD [Planctomycetota bacterium]
MPLILGLETSCDETAAAVVRDGCEVLSSVVATQHDLHVRYAGVVPEIASRAHVQRLLPVIDDALAQAACGLADLDGIAVGHRPGLIGSLIVGVAAAKALAWSLGKPLIGVDHVHAHLYAAALRSSPGASPAIEFPAVGLVVSGGHTSLYRMDSPSDLTVLGRTIDDAVGEAYDKAAVILDAGYPGGPALDRLAQSGDPDADGVADLPVSMLDGESFDFSFSGLKTALLYAVRGRPVGRGKAATFERDASDLSPKRKADLAAAFQHAAIDALIRKLRRAFERFTDPPRSIVLGGGVSANSLLRERVRALGEELGVAVHLPAMAYCVDNAAMIAGHADAMLARGETAGLDLPVVATTRG